MHIFAAALLVLVVPAAVTRAQNVTTYKYDNQVSGVNTSETILKPSNVNVATFGLLFSDPVDGQGFAQPLYLSQVAIPDKSARNVIYVATAHDSVYAFDADAGGDPLWQRSFISPAAGDGITTVPQPDVVSGDIQPEIGILGTPVIDPGSGTLYLVVKTREAGRGDNHIHYVQKLHALDVATGAEKLDGPATIGDVTCDDAWNSGSHAFDFNLATAPNTPHVAGTNWDAVKGQIYFNALRANQRPSLALYRGVVYVGWSSHGDTGPYHGWLIGFDAKTLLPLPNRVWCVTPDGNEGGIWQSGCGPSIDRDGNLFVSTANGNFDGATKARDWSQTFIKFATGTGLLTAKLGPAPDATFDYFSPHNEQSMSNGDVDMGCGGMLIFDEPGLATPRLVIGSGKDGAFYLLNRDDLGHWNPSTNHILQEFARTDQREIMSTPVFFNHTLFYNRNGEALMARAFRNGRFSSLANRSSHDLNGRGGGPVLSADGDQDGIVWMLNNGGPATLEAYSADALGDVPEDPPVEPVAAIAPTNGVYTNATAPQPPPTTGKSLPALYKGRLLDGGVKFTHPLVVNGKVYAMCATKHGNRISSAHLCVFGLIDLAGVTAKPEAPSHLQGASSSPDTVELTWVNHDAKTAGFLVERSPVDTNNWAQIGTAGGQSSNYQDNGVDAAATYRYRVSAVNKNGTSAPSNVAEVRAHDNIAEDGLVAYWDFNEGNGTKLHDLTGHGHDGAAKGEVSWTQGIWDSQGLEFHGTGNAKSHVDVMDSTELDFVAQQSFSLVAWVRPSSLPDHESGVVAKSREAGAWYGLYLSPGGTWSFRGAGAKMDIRGGLALADTWQQVIAVQDGVAGTRTLYVDGEMVAQGAAAMANGTGGLWIGQGNADNEAFAGLIDDVRVYNRALTAGDVQRLYGNYLPRVSLTEPLDGATFSGSKELKLTATFSTTAPNTGVNEVRFYQGNQRIGEAHCSPGNCTWQDVAPGTYVLTARAEDSNGNTVASLPVHVTVLPPPVPPVTNAHAMKAPATNAP